MKENFKDFLHVSLEKGAYELCKTSKKWPGASKMWERLSKRTSWNIV